MYSLHCDCQDLSSGYESKDERARYTRKLEVCSLLLHVMSENFIVPSSYARIALSKKACCRVCDLSESSFESSELNNISCWINPLY